MIATFYVGDAVTVMNTLPEKSVDLILTSPPFLALRSYLPQDHPDKALEGGSQATPGAYIDWLLDVVEACARVLAPHGSLCIELGDTYSGSGGSGGDYAEAGLRAGQPAFRQGYYDPNRGRAPRQAESYGETSYVSNSGGRGWPLAKSLSLIPETFRFAMVYGTNPHTGRRTEPWRLRNVIRWVRPNPPVGALGDKFRPATSELMVFCKAKDRFFDLDAVREPVSEHTQKYYSADSPYFQRLNANPERQAGTGQLPERGDGGFRQSHPSGGAPPLDWWNIPPGGYPGAHYAVWPPDLLVKPIKAMCPEKVCRRCGEASRRINSALNEERQRIASLILSQRNLLGLKRRDLLPLFIAHYKNSDSVLAQISNWESAKNVPVPRDWGLLKDRLAISTKEFDGLIEAESRWNDATYEMLNSNGPKYLGRAHETAMGNITTRAIRHVNEQGFTDCRHDDYRPGLVLDPFAGSGTTLAVATGHGRDAIGIDLDERNYELALDRVGPLVLERGEVAA